MTQFTAKSDLPGVRIVKLGGSLLDEPRLPELLRRWLDAQPQAVDVLVAGGGRLVDVVRDLDRVQTLGDERAHWLALRAMSVTAALLRELLSGSAYVEDLNTLVEEIRHGSSRQTIVFDCWQFLRCVEASTPGERLPKSWQATSDSVAARLSVALAHHEIAPAELVLLKSTTSACEATLDDAAAAGIVDECFPRQAATLPSVRIVNLRSRGFDEIVYPAGGRRPS
ncbi:MAG: hypothetical protein AB7U73_20030 [Pirellulales bacterium]